MKYTISAVNQLGISKFGLLDKTDVVDWALLDYIYDWQQNPRGLFLEKKVWINFKSVSEQMPLLGLNDKGAVSRRIKKMRELGLLDTLQDVDGRLYGNTTALYYDVVKFRLGLEERYYAKPVDENQHPLTKVNTPVDENQHPVDENQHSIDIPDTSNTSDKNNTRMRAREDVFALLALYCITGQLANDFIKLRKAKRAAITKTAMEGFQREADKAGISIAEAVRISIERGWQGFKSEWVNPRASPAVVFDAGDEYVYEPSAFAAQPVAINGEFERV